MVLIYRREQYNLRMNIRNDRIDYFDALRGVAALVVFGEHFLKVFAPSAYVDDALWPRGGAFADWLTYPPFNLLINGAPAVMLFFVLSGWVLARYAAKQESINLLAEFSKRYLRLMLPCLASLLLLYGVAVLGDFGATQFIQDTGSNERPFQSFGANFIGVVKQGVVDVLFLQNYDLNPALWTLSSEMYGALLIFSMFWLYRNFETKMQLAPEQVIALRMIVSGLLLFSFGYLVFLSVAMRMDLYLIYGMFVGMLLHELTSSKRVSELLKRNVTIWLGPVFVLSILLLGYSTRGAFSNPYAEVSFWGLSRLHEYFYNTLGAALLLLCIHSMPSWQKKLSSPFMLWLGRQSFSIYLTHYIVLMTAGTYLASSFYDYGIIQTAAIAFITLVSVIGLAAVFTKYVDEWSIIYARKTKEFIIYKLKMNFSKKHNQEQAKSEDC